MKKYDNEMKFYVYIIYHVISILIFIRKKDKIWIYTLLYKHVNLSLNPTISNNNWRKKIVTWTNQNHKLTKFMILTNEFLTNECL